MRRTEHTAIVGKDRLSIAFCAKGIFVKILSSLHKLWSQLWEYPGGKSLIWTLFPLFVFLERPERTSTSSVASNELLSRGIEPQSRLATALLSLMASLNVQERRTKKRVRARVREIIIRKHDLMIRNVLD